MEMNRVRAFTLIELLVVIVIIALLMGIAFPVFSSIQNSARKTQAKNDVTQIVTAVNAYYTEYGKYPLLDTQTGLTDADYGMGSTQNDKLFNVLRMPPGFVDNQNGAVPQNPRNISFISPPYAKNGATRGGISSTDGQFYDPWGMPYVIRIDSNYDNAVTNPYGTNGAGPDKIPQGVIAWSFGQNGILGGGNPTDAQNFSREPGTGGTYTSSGDVISWQ
jgi:prepilin-type N-terminal cleavage/methylation domain-containing protein